MPINVSIQPGFIAAPSGSKLSRVSAWARTLRNRGIQVNPFSGPWYPAYVHPSRDQIVLGFVISTRTAWLLRHKAAGVYEVLGDGELWFDDPPERALNLLDDQPDSWMPVPDNIFAGAAS